MFERMKKIFPSTQEMAEEQVNEAERLVANLENLARYHQQMADTYRAGAERIRSGKRPVIELKAA